jgi:A/G-specific adenine glycosylase
MADLARVQTLLLDWYASNARDLPWRQTRDAYAILVAEVMLQQTQVDRVIPKWHDWLERFPTLADLARASRADAIRAWQGLGYNLRAVRLHAIAQQAVAEYGGVLPKDVEGLLRLRGIGRYTAGAVACFAYEQPVAMVDTNVRRVLSRVFGWDPRSVDRLASSLVPVRSAYAWSQALMDLGATLCRSRRPLCLVCPLVSECGGPGYSAARLRVGSATQFAGSRRFYRGRIVQLLRDLPRGETAFLADLIKAVGGSRDLVHELAADGLVRIDPAERVGLAD